MIEPEFGDSTGNPITAPVLRWEAMQTRRWPSGEIEMDPLYGLFFVGLGTLALLAAFVRACDRV